MALPDVADTYRITVFQNVTGVPVINVFYARDTAIGGPSAISVAQGFWDNIKTVWRAVMHTSFGPWFNRVQAEQLYPPYGFGTYAIPTGEQTGSRTGTVGDILPYTLAANIKLNVATRITRPGSKRIAGACEGDIVGFVIQSGFVTLLQALAAEMDDTFTAVPSGIVMTPVIVGYPTPLQPGAVRVQDVTLAEVQTNISHQVSRDYRR